ncbi:MAG: potassium transporter Kup [Betaproteobacteria bacterium RIFCSPLOWO2_02_FULL_67_26]|nr:MAG: potassium transporter Kup [Betaproteobacteria bacterium RIFCSPLOWO2_02_FULL_67_26]
MANGPHLKQSRAALTLLALGVVYGDIGTSPLYAVKETFAPGHGIALNVENILGGVSAIFWALMIVVSLKYVVLVMRADNRGEGGIMALLALALASVKDRQQWHKPLLYVGVFGASLFYGDAVLTPAISVLSAVEGLEVGTSAFKPYVLPISLGLLVALFLLQRRGTALVGSLFGPICVAWFLALAAAGIWNIVKNPVVLQALNPNYALHFATGHGFASFVVLGSVLLAVTGAEALYADMGHFGKSAVRTAWFGLVAPALVLNYFGQGALLIADPKAIENPFYLAYPAWALYPMVALATAATVIASQAMISGAYSITQQAIQLGYLPRMNIMHTSAKTAGQIYIPAANWILLIAVFAAVIGFGSSSKLAAAYGVAVIGTMLSTSFLTFFVIRYGWGYPLVLCIFATGFFLSVDTAFFSAAMFKVLEGGWFPLAMGVLVFTVMTTWRRGRSILFDRLRRSTVPLESFLESLFRDEPHRVPGTAVFLTATPEVVPHALLHNLYHNKVLHERVVFLTVQGRDVPWVPFDERVTVEPLGHHCFRLTLHFGFMNRPDVTQALSELCPDHGLDFDLMQTSFFLSRERVIPVAGLTGGMALWREKLFAAMQRNSGSAVEYFNIPANRVIELGTQVEI